MERRLILRGLLSGVVAGVLAFVFARIFAEPQIDRAIAYEEGRSAAQDALDKAAGLPVSGGGAETFSRGLQANIGLGIGIVAYAVALSGLYAVVYSFCVGRFGAVRARTLAMLLALVAFGAVYFVPFLKYPSNPPAVGNEDSISQRSGLYLTMVLFSLVCALGAVILGRVLQRRYGTFAAVVLAGVGFAVVIGIVMAVLPSLGELAANKAEFGGQGTETPLPLRDPSGAIVFPGFPADVLYYFRLYSVGAQVVLWGTLGLVYGALVDRMPELKQQSPQTAEAAIR